MGGVFIVGGGGVWVVVWGGGGEVSMGYKERGGLMCGRWIKFSKEGGLGCVVVCEVK